MFGICAEALLSKLRVPHRQRKKGARAGPFDFLLEHALRGGVKQMKKCLLFTVAGLFLMVGLLFCISSKVESFKVSNYIGKDGM